jgi:hypothetical protein
MVIAVVQPEGILFQSDLAPGTPGPDADALYQLAVEHGWNLKTVVGGHGGTTPWAAVVAAASGN